VRSAPLTRPILHHLRSLQAQSRCSRQTLDRGLTCFITTHSPAALNEPCTAGTIQITK
jgi:hypothetical protein